MSRAGTAPRWWREACAEHGARSLTAEVPSHGIYAARESGDVARRDFIRGEVVTRADERVRHAWAVLARMASTRGALRVEIPDGRRGIVLHALVAKRASADGAAWREVARHSDGLAAVSDADALAAVVAVEVGRERHEGYDMDTRRMVDTRPVLVLVEVERVTIPAPARGDVGAFLERKRAPGWKRPRVKIPAVRSNMPPRGTAERVGLGSLVTWREHVGDGVTEASGPWLVIDRAPHGSEWHIQHTVSGELATAHKGRMEIVGRFGPEMDA